MNFLLAIFLAVQPYALPFPELYISPGTVAGHRYELNRIAQNLGEKCREYRVQKYKYVAFSTVYAVQSQIEREGYRSTLLEARETKVATVWTIIADGLIVQAVAYRDGDRTYRIKGGVIRGCTWN